MPRLLGLAAVGLVIWASSVLAGSSNSLLDVSPDSKWLLAANTDNDDLVAFLQSLPYEPLPGTTPNTVPYRFVPQKK